MSWQKGLISVGGETEGQVLKITPTIWPGYTCGSNTYNTFTMNDDRLFSAFPIDLDWSGPSIATNKLFFKIAKKDQNGTVTGFIAFRYSYEKGVNSQGRVFLTVRGDLGYMDLQGNYTSVHGIPDVTQSIGGTSIYQFKAWVHICFDIRNGENLFGVAIQVEDTVNIDFDCKGVITTQSFVQGISYSEKSYSPEFGPESDSDGYGMGGVIGTHDKHSDHVGIPTKPQYGFTSAGFLNHYRISAKGLSMLGEALFPEPQGPSLDVLGAIDRLCVNMYNSKIVDYVIDCRVIPVTAPATNMVNITCGGKVLLNPNTQQAYSAYLVDEDYVDVDCGVISTPLTEGCFLDMISKAKIFIPFYGFVDLAPEYWHGAKIGLYYRFNLMDGSFMVWLTSAPFRSELESAGDMEIIGQYAGNACIHLPINSQSYSQIIGGMITTGAAIVGAAAAGAIGGAAAKTITAGAVQTAVSGAANIANGRPQLINNNSYNGSAALMSCRTPYLLIEFSEAQFSRRYVDENGLPAIINRVLGTMSGFTTCVNPIIDFACEQEEAEEIRNLLRSGVIL